MVDLDNKAEILKIRAQERLKGLTPLQKIKEYYNSDLPIELSEECERIRQRLNLVIRLQSKGLSTFNIINKIRKVFDVSESQAYRDISNAGKLFGDVLDSDRKGKKVVAEEMLQTAYRAAKAAGNVKQMVEATTRLMKLHQLDKEEVDKPDFSNLRQSVFVLVMPPEHHKLYDDFIKSSGSIDVSKFFNNIAEHAEEAELTEGGTDRTD